jgi:hypothetical protein
MINQLGELVSSLYNPTVACVSLVSIPSHKFVRPPCWYYQLQDTKEHEFRVVSNDITSIPNFIQISPAVLEVNHADR